MTKLELIREIENNYKNGISVERSLDAVDKYSSALLRQTDVSLSLPSLSREQAENMVLHVWNAGMDAEEVGMPSFDMAKGSKFITDIVDRLCGNAS